MTMTDDQTHVLYLNPRSEVLDVEERLGCLPKQNTMAFIAGMLSGFFLGGVVVFAFLALLLVS